MKTSCQFFLILLPLSLELFANSSYAETTPQEVLMSSQKLTCMFTTQQNTRWSSEGPIRHEGKILETFIFESINHKAGTAVGPWNDESVPVRIRVFPHNILFFELTESGEFSPVITTILDEYFPGTDTFKAVRSSHGYSAFMRFIAKQSLGTCRPGE
jgi:hypothetical protein